MYESFPDTFESSIPCSRLEVGEGETGRASALPKRFRTSTALMAAVRLTRVMVPREGAGGRRWHGVCSSVRQTTSPRAKGKRKTVVLFAIGLMAGIALGMIIVGFLAIGAYERGFSEALERRKAWRTELVARTGVGTRALVAARKAS
jgi:hypothetical protein